jgi:hypothetical protein
VTCPPDNPARSAQAQRAWGVVKTDRDRFDALRAAYLDASGALQAHVITLELKYGGSTQWASTTEKRKLEQLRARQHRAGDKLFALIQRVSPRDWSTGVPTCYVYGELSWDDATRPLAEPLAVSPPCAYGHTAAMR